MKQSAKNGVMVAAGLAFSAMLMVYAWNMTDPRPRAAGGGGEAPPEAVPARRQVPAPEPVEIPPGPLALRQANTMNLDPVPGNAALAPTLISLDLDNADLEDALGEFARAAGATFAMRIPSRLTQGRAVNLHLKDQPLLEAKLQLETQAGVPLTFTTPATGGMSMSGAIARTPRLPGVWTIVGPLAFVVTEIHHEMVLDETGSAVAVARGEAAEAFFLTINVMAEPKIKILQYPGMLAITEARDDRGRSLIVTGEPTGAARYQRPLNISPQFRVELVYPGADAGRRIGILKGTVQTMMQGQSQTVTIDDPLAAEPSEQNLGGMQLSLGKAAWNQQTGRLEIKATYRRGTIDPAMWTRISALLPNIRPRAVTDPAGGLFSASGTEGRRNDEFTTTYSFQSTGARNAEPVPKQISWDVPTAVEEVTLPLEFKDLPLP